MRHSVKLLLNTIASSSKILVTAVSTILATRYALEELGQSDFGLFNLVAGIIVMLSFFSGALAISGQRFFSIALGKEDNKRLNDYYNSSLGIHLIIGGGLSIVLLLSEAFLFDGFLNITAAQREPAIKIFNILIISAFITILTIPFSALANAHEDLGILSGADILASIIKLIGAASLVLFEDKLVIYSIFMLGATLVKAVVEYYWCLSRYKNVSINLKRIYNRLIWKEMFGFVSWNTLGSLAVVLRNQGIAVLLNIYFGTIVNASYGVANQVNSLILSFAAALTTVFAPTIIKSYGAGNIELTVKTAVMSSKLSFLLSSLMALPILVFLNSILIIWLDDIPAGTEIFTRYIVFCFLILQLYPGINRAIYATGNIKAYQIMLSIILVAVLPVGAVLYHYGASAYAVLIVLLVSQFFTLVLTISSAKKLLGLNARHFWLFSVLKPIILFGLLVSICSAANKYLCISGVYEIILSSGVMVAVYSLLYYKLILNVWEQEKMRGLINHLISKVHI